MVELNSFRLQDARINQVKNIHLQLNSCVKYYDSLCVCSSTYAIFLAEINEEVNDTKCSPNASVLEIFITNIRCH